MTYKIVQGWTAPIDCVLLADGAAINLTGMTISLIAWAKGKTALTVAGDVSIVNAATGVVRYEPTSGDALITAANSPVSVRWVISDSSGIKYVPSGSPDRWVISRP